MLLPVTERKPKAVGNATNIKNKTEMPRIPMYIRLDPENSKDSTKKQL